MRNESPRKTGWPPPELTVRVPYRCDIEPLYAAPAAQVAQEGGGVATTTAADDLLETLEDMARQHCHTSAKGETDSGALSTNAQVLRLLAKAGRFRIDREAGRMVIGYWPENDPERTAGVPGIAMADNWQQYAKDGETAQACIERHRREQDALLKLLAQAREPLTSEQIIALLPAGWTGMLAQVMEFARRIERACGVKGDGRG